MDMEVGLSRGVGIKRVTGCLRTKLLGEWTVQGWLKVDPPNECKDLLICNNFKFCHI